MTKRILVVDDENSIRTLYRDELLDEGYDVDTANNGKMALEALSRGSYDLIILDISMPELNGLEFIGKVREVNMELPIVICTAFGTFKQDLAAWGADDYIVKSSDLTELKTRVKALLERKEP